MVVVNVFLVEGVFVDLSVGGGGGGLVLGMSWFVLFLIVEFWILFICDEEIVIIGWVEGLYCVLLGW